MRLICLLLLSISPLAAQQLPIVNQPFFRKDTFSIVNYGAIPDNLALNTEAINRTIADCTGKGGGVVLVPPGLWITGPIQLKSNVNLHLAKGAVLQFSEDINQYPLVRTNWEGVDAFRCHSPIYGVDVENIAITGYGLLDGAGHAWRPVKKSKLTPPEWNQLVASGGFLNEAQDTWYPTLISLRGSQEKRPGVIAEGYDIERAKTVKDFLRPNMVSLIRCERILLEGVTFQNSPAWCLHPLLSNHLTLRNLTVRNPWNAQNGDGVDIESCRNVLVENSTFDVGDDGICIKSGRDEEGRKRGVATEDVIIRNCTVFHGHGGFVVGSEMSGGARNIFVSDCNFLGTDIGLRFKTARGRGGIVEKIYVKNIRMSKIGGAAILLDMYYLAKDPLTIFSGDEKIEIVSQPVTEATPQFRDIQIENVVCKGAGTAVFIRGLPEMNIKRISFQDVTIESEKGFVCIEGEDIKVKNVTIYSKGESVLTLQNSKDILLDSIAYKEANVLLSIQGERSRNIQLLNTNGTLSKKEILLGKGVSQKIVSRK
jgi:DNA sulfur modification protein DndE